MDCLNCSNENIQEPLICSQCQNSGCCRPFQCEHKRHKCGHLPQNLETHFVSTKRIQATPKQMARLRARVSRCWIPLRYSMLPPQNTMVLVKFRINKEETKVYTGKFRYDIAETCEVGKWQVPLNYAKAHGLCAWMPIPL